MRALIGSPVRKPAPVVAAWLDGLAALELSGIEADYLFLDDCDDPEASALLRRWVPKAPGAVCVREAPGVRPAYLQDGPTHAWSVELVWRVAAMRDAILAAALAGGYDAAFLVDADLVLRPQTLRCLVGREKDIIAEVFWTRWTPEAEPAPNVWLGGQYELYARRPGERLDPEEIARRQGLFLQTLRRPGCYPVLGLGACTLVSRRALEAGVSYREVPQLVDRWGEDRHFCARAGALGLELWADTSCPPLHLYRDEDLQRLQAWREGREDEAAPAPSAPRPPLARRVRWGPRRLTLTMTFRDEAGRYLRRVLEDAARYVDDAVFVDDGSTDGSADIARDVFGRYAVIHRQASVQESAWSGNEPRLRRQQWEAAVAEGAEWILCLDADEMFEPRAGGGELRRLLDDAATDVWSFRLYDLWAEGLYRSDALWTAHRRYWPVLVRVQPGWTPRWQEQPLHGWRLPCNLGELPTRTSDLRLLHLGWMDPADRARKAERYLTLDPGGRWGNLDQYRSILDPDPHLEAL